MNDLSGQNVKSYELHSLIGAGGFGAVYQAYQPLIKRDVAIKIILPEYANHPDFIRRFEYEAQLIARLEHLHIVPLYDYWREPDSAYLVMRLLRGGNLRGVLRHGPLSLDAAVKMVDQISSALAAAHRRGIVHRDMKPDNILFDEEGNAYLADFGIAKDLSAKNYADADNENELSGSPLYLSPEQIRTQPVSPQTDVYSLGIVLFETLTGRPPFISEQLTPLFQSHLHDPVPLLQTLRADLPATLDAVIQRATAKLPADRYPDTLSFATDFRRAALREDAPSIQRLPAPAVEADDILVFTKSLTPGTLILITEEVQNPYKGLQSFEEADAGDFFGRTALVEQLLARLREDRFLAVIGPSGSGKSSVVKAGVLPALRQGLLPGSQNWFSVQMVPGADPFQELEAALLAVAINQPGDIKRLLRDDERGLLHAVERILPHDTSELVLTIDQFEEIFTQVDDEDTRAHFLKSLLLAVTASHSRLRVLVTLRADFYDRPLLYPGFGELVRSHSEVVLPMNTREMEEAIVRPAERAGIAVEPGLVAAVIAEVSQQPGALPLMQYALTEIFERRQDNILTVDAYHHIGGVLGALARRAEELYQASAPATRSAMQQMFLRLVTLGEGNEDSRRRVSQAELMSVAGENIVSNVLDTLGKYRLLTFDRDPQTRTPTVEIAHEALIREWSRLREWLDASRDDIRLQRRIRAAADEWHNQNCDPSYLAAGSRLQQFEVMLNEEGHIALAQDERDYIQASITRRQQQEAAEAARQAREEALEKRSRNRLRALAIVGLLAAVLTSFLAVLAYLNFRSAEDAREKAERNALISDSLALVSSAQLQLQSHNNDLSIALALEANDLPDPPPAAQNMLARAAFSPGAQRVFRVPDGAVFGVVYSPDNLTALSGGDGQAVILWDVQTAQEIRRFEGHSDDVRAVAISPDGKLALSGGYDLALILWDLTTGQEIRRLEGHSDAIRSIAFSPDSRYAISGASDSLIILWDIATGQEIRRFAGHSDEVRSVAFSPDGTRILSGSYDATMLLWDVATGENLFTFPHSAEVTAVAFSPDGLSALSGGADSRIHLWDLTTQTEIQNFAGHTVWVKSVQFSPDARSILSSSDDGTIRVWDIASGDEICRFVGHEDSVAQAVFSADGDQVLSASGDATLRLWTITNGAEIRRFKGHTDEIVSVDLSADGTRLLSGSFDATARVWDVATGQQLTRFDGHSDILLSVDLSADGTRALTSDAAGGLLLWDTATGETIQSFSGGHDGIVINAVLNTDGTRVLSGGDDARIILWDVASGSPLLTLQDPDSFFIFAVAISPDGKLVLSGDDLGNVILWNLEDGTEVRRFTGHTGSINSVAFSPTGTQVLSASQDTTIILWDLSSGAVLRRLEGHTASVQRAVFNTDASRIASGSEDGTVRIWNSANGQEIRRLEPNRTVWSVAYSGSALVSGLADATLRQWDVEPLQLDKLRRWTFGNRYVRDLTCVERIQYRVEPLCDTAGS